MAQKRMFDRAIIETRNFLLISLTAKALYFLLGMEADDEGFVDPERVLRLYGGEYGDVKNLIDAQLLIPFNSGVVVITHWKQNNWLDSRRIKETQYQEERKNLQLTESGKYLLSNGLAYVKPEESSTEEYRGEESRVGDETSPSTPSSLKDLKVKVVSFSETDLELATLLRDKILSNIPTFKEPNLPMWAKEVRLMRERDNRTEEQIRYMINWCQKDHFWQANILSTRKLRDKFDTMVAQVKRGKTADKAKVGTVLL